MILIGLYYFSNLSVFTCSSSLDAYCVRTCTRGVWAWFSCTPCVVRHKGNGSTSLHVLRRADREASHTTAFIYIVYEYSDVLALSAPPLRGILILSNMDFLCEYIETSSEFCDGCYGFLNRFLTILSLLM